MSTTSPRINTELLQEPQLDSWGCWPVLCVFLGPRKLWNYCCFEFISTRIKKKKIHTHEISHCILNTGYSLVHPGKPVYFFYLPTNSFRLFCDAAKYCNLGNPKFPGFTGAFLKFKALCLRIAWCVADTGRVVIRLTVQLWIMCAFFLFLSDFGGKFHARKIAYHFTTNWIRVIESVLLCFILYISSLSCTFERNTGELLNVL